VQSPPSEANSCSAVKKKFKFYVTQCFILVSTRASHLTPSSTNSKHSSSVRYNLISTSDACFQRSLIKLRPQIKMHALPISQCMVHILLQSVRSQSNESPYNSRNIKKHRFHKEFIYVIQTAYCRNCLEQFIGSNEECLNCYTSMICTLWCLSLVEWNSRLMRVSYEESKSIFWLFA
jgi:hypothetical protein